MKIYEKYSEALKVFTDYVTVYEWAQKVGELYPDLLEKAEKEAQAQKQDTTGLHEIAARISSRLSSGKFVNVLIDESERPRRVRYITKTEQKKNFEKELNDDIAPITRQEIINKSKDKLKIMELYRFDEFKNIQKGFKDYFGLDFELDHAQALLDRDNKGSHHPNNIQLLLKYHNNKKNNKSWERFSYKEQEKYIKDLVNFQSNVANSFDIQIDNQILSNLLSRLKAIYD